MHEKEELIKQQRRAEAVKNDLMGLEGKLGCILKYMGDPIISQNSIFYGSTSLPDVWHIPDDNPGIPTMDEDQPIYELGKHFSALSHGMHLEINFFYDERRLTVTYKGHPVYCEIENELEAYVPLAEWEDKVDELLKIAKMKEHVVVGKLKEEKKEEENRSILNYLQTLRTKWGI